ncbi:MAG: cytochrome C554 [Candidatus Eisenbacteria bacterium]|uniref:Cytochrome C554 n=1 Tax=Eiseniibacteriota bacterium TaxID=2212470 RepID=A0A937X9B1_UNCEI|nr:cytochrome C554 [Candidatus Eisenbacteria bacterium]
MRKIVWLAGALALVAAIVWIGTARGEGGAPAAEVEKKEFGFIGSQSCKACHNNPEKGAQFDQWAKSPHANAYNSLLTDESKKICADMKIAKAPHEAPECLRCHVTGWDAKAELLGAKYDRTEGVGCESCHGPAAEWKTPHIKDVPKAMTLGMIHPDEALCVSCHNPESPTYKEFKFEEAMKAVAHPNPKKAQ